MPVFQLNARKPKVLCRRSCHSVKSANFNSSKCMQNFGVIIFLDFPFAVVVICPQIVIVFRKFLVARLIFRRINSFLFG